jgi:hypothetical protein
MPKFSPLSTFEPLIPKWQHAAETKESPLSGMPDISMAMVVGCLALWVVLMVNQEPCRAMY